MKKITLVAIVLAMSVALLTPAGAWAQEPKNCSSLLLVKKGQLMKLVYENSATRQAAEVVARFKQFEWKEPRDRECIPMRPDIQVLVKLKAVYFSYITIRNGQCSRVDAAYSTDDPCWRIADTVMYHADKFRGPSLTHPPAL